MGFAGCTIEPRYAPSALKQSHRRAMQATNMSKGFLGHLFPFAQATHAIAQHKENLLQGIARLSHAGHRTFRLNIRIIQRALVVF